MSGDDAQLTADKAALLIIDMLNRLDFDEPGDLPAAAEAAAERIAALRQAARDRGMPVVFVNDHFGEWRAERSEIIRQAADPACRGRALAERLRPEDEDYFVVKPQFSGFYATTLPVLLPKLGVSRLVMTGVAADICVLFTAADAHMRDYSLWVPADTVASETPQRTRWALEIMRNAMGAETRPTAELSIADWLAAISD